MLSFRFNLHRMQSWYFTPFLPCFYDFYVLLSFLFLVEKCDGKFFLFRSPPLRRKSAWKNIKYDYIDKNKIINLWQFLSLLLQCKTILLLKIYRKNFFPPNIPPIFPVFLREKIKISPWNVNITVEKNATRKTAFLDSFSSPMKCGQNNFPFKLVTQICDET